MNTLVFNSSITLEEAIKLLDENGNGFLPIVNEENILLGVITDGDLRRGILNKVYSVDAIMNTNPVTLPAYTPRGLVRKELKKLHKRQMPLVDEKGRLIDVVVLDDFETSSKDNWVVIMAGGIGSRLGDLTKNTPKPMLPIAGKPILQHIIKNFKELGFKKFVFCVNFKANVIKDYFGDGSDFGVEVTYTHEKKRMGTAGALSLLKNKVRGDFFVVNGDVITTLDFEDFLNFHTQEKAMATMCVKRHSYQLPYAGVEYDNKNSLTGISEKPKYDFYINAGQYLLNDSIFDLVPEDSFFDMPELFDQLINKNEVVKVFRMEDYWLDIGRLDDYKKGNNDFNVQT